MSASVKKGDLFYRVNYYGHLHVARVSKVTEKQFALVDNRDAEDFISPVGPPGFSKTHFKISELPELSRTEKDAWLAHIALCEKRRAEFLKQLQEQDALLSKAKEKVAKL